MKFQIASDIHLEFFTKPKVTLPGGDILLLSGDICVASFLKENRTDKAARRLRYVFDSFFKEECSKYNKVFYIMGNHEHYHGIFNLTADSLREYLKDTNVTVLDKEFADLENEWQIFGATLWTDYGDNHPIVKIAAKSNMSDHHLISKFYDKGVRNFSPDDALEEHEHTLKDFYELFYDEKRIGRPTIVMTHHAPTAKSIHPKYENDTLNYCYYSDLSNDILDNPNIKFWIHGHTHTSFEYDVGDCKVICNPRGYEGYDLNPEFRLDTKIEITPQ